MQKLLRHLPSGWCCFCRCLSGCLLMLLLLLLLFLLLLSLLLLLLLLVGWPLTSASATAAPALMTVNTLISVTAVGWRCHKQATLRGSRSVCNALTQANANFIMTNAQSGGRKKCRSFCTLHSLAPAGLEQVELIGRSSNNP